MLKGRRNIIMITNITTNSNFWGISNSNNIFTSKKEDKDPILEAIKRMLLTKSITEKEVKGEKLTEEEQEFKNNNIVIPDPETLLLSMLNSKENDVHNSNRINYEDKKVQNTKNNDDLIKLKDILKEK